MIGSSRRLPGRNPMKAGQEAHFKTEAPNLKERSKPPRVGCYKELKTACATSALRFSGKALASRKMLMKLGKFSQFGGYYQHSRNVFLVQK